ncbi:long-chain fatty acid--CoA ligase [Vibrio sp.]|nr:long-chain fatty acid--CoA ligase [Vibrio sp.]
MKKEQNEEHIVERIRQHFSNKGAKPALRYRSEQGWHDISWRCFGENVDKSARALLSLGVGIQDTVSIWSSNMPNWSICDFATLHVRAITVPIYPTSTAEQARYIFQDSNSKIVFVGEQAQYDMACSIQEQHGLITTVIALSDDITLDINAKNSLSWSGFLALGQSENYQTELEHRLHDKNMEDLLTLIYTSGTTGKPKGVMLNYRNIGAQLVNHDKKLDLTPRDISLCFLPLSHVFERAWTFYVLYKGATNCYLQDTNLVKQALSEVKPTTMCAVPRFFEKIYSTIYERLESAPAWRKRLFHLAMSIGESAFDAKNAGQPLALSEKLLLPVCDKVIFSKIRHLLGGRIHFFPCGGAKLDPQIGRFFHIIGVNVKLGYGMTETAATVSCWDSNIFNPESIGTIMPGVDIKIGDQNEILVRGPMVMKGYFNNEKATKDTFDAHGYLKTGDAGYIDDQGNLFITDRIKELMKTSGGKYIAPQVIEGLIGKDHYIEQIAVVADGRKFVSALIVPCFEALQSIAEQHGLSISDKKMLLESSVVIDFFKHKIDELQQELASFEQVKHFALLSSDFSIDNDELTPTMKLKRRNIESNYAELIESMYTRKR